MTLSEIRLCARAQTGDRCATDADDDALINAYVNEAQLLLYGEYAPEETQALSGDGDVSALPEAYHGALADYGSYRLLGNSGLGAQQRSQYYHMRFELAQMQLRRHFERRAARTRLGNKFN